MKLSVIVAPESAGAAARSREIHEVDAFAAALEDVAGIAVPVYETSLANAPDNGFIVVFDNVEVNVHAELGPRMILVNVDRADIPRRLEQLSVAGVVEKHRYVMWRSRRDSGDGLIGRKDLAARIGAARTGWPLGGRYDLLVHPRCRSLPELLITYLTGLERG